MTRVLPDPAPAKTSCGPSPWVTAAIWSELRRRSRSMAAWRLTREVYLPRGARLLGNLRVQPSGRAEVGPPPRPRLKKLFGHRYLGRVLKGNRQDRVPVEHPPE